MIRTLRGLLALTIVTAVAGAAQAEVKVTLSEMHLCCGACLKAVEKAATGAGAAATCDKANAQCTITAADDATAAKAVAAVAAAGFHAASDNAKATMTDDSGVSGKPTRVTKLTISGVHNCCNGCTKSIKEAVKEVTGVSADTCKAKETSFEVTGNFDPKALVKSLNDAGFHVKVN